MKQKQAFACFKACFKTQCFLRLGTDKAILTKIFTEGGCKEEDTDIRVATIRKYSY